MSTGEVDARLHCPPGPWASASASSISDLTTLCGGGASVSKTPPERLTQLACIPAASAPITSKGFEEISRTDSMGQPRRFATCRYTFGEGLYTWTSSALTNPAQYAWRLVA